MDSSRLSPNPFGFARDRCPGQSLTYIRTPLSTVPSNSTDPEQGRCSVPFINRITPNADSGYTKRASGVVSDSKRQISLQYTDPG